jgi:hypothetical protein
MVAILSFAVAYISGFVIIETRNKNKRGDRLIYLRDGIYMQSEYRFLYMKKPSL